MQYEKYIERIHYIEELIEKRATGTPKELARKLGISERMVFRYIDEIRTLRGGGSVLQKRKYL